MIPRGNLYIYIAKYQKLALQWYSTRHPLGTDSLHPKKNIFNGKKKVEETFRRTTEEDTSSRTDGHGIDVACTQ